MSVKIIFQVVTRYMRNVSVSPVSYNILALPFHVVARYLRILLSVCGGGGGRGRLSVE